MSYMDLMNVWTDPIEFVYIDTETTNLKIRERTIWEVAFATQDSPVFSTQVAHSQEVVDPVSSYINGYPARRDSGLERPLTDPWFGLMFLAMQRGTIVGSNPQFDLHRIELTWGHKGWNHQTVDLAAYGAGVLGERKPIGLSRLTKRLQDLGFIIPDPDHTAVGDVKTSRACHRALLDLAHEKTEVK